MNMTRPVKCIFRLAADTGRQGRGQRAAWPPLPCFFIEKRVLNENSRIIGTGSVSSCLLGKIAVDFAIAAGKGNRFVSHVEM